MKKFYQRICNILTEENITFDKKLIQHAIVHFFPDFRRCINELQRYSATGQLSDKILSNVQNEKIDALLEAIESKKFNSVRKFILENWHGTEQELYRSVYEELMQKASPQSIPDIILILSKYGFESTFAVDKEIHTLACMVELMSLPIEFK